MGDAGNLPHSARISVGDEWNSLRVSAIHDNGGNYTNVMVAWDVFTGQVQLASDFEDNIATVVVAVFDATTKMQATAESMVTTAEVTSSQSQAAASA